MSCGVGVAEFVKEPTSAEGSVRAPICCDCPPLSSCFTTQWPQFSLARYATAFSFSSIAPSGFPRALGNKGLSGTAVVGRNLRSIAMSFLDPYFTFLPILGTKTPTRFGGDADGQMFKVHIPPRYESAFGIAKTRHQIELEANLFCGRARLKTIFRVPHLHKLAGRFRQSWTNRQRLGAWLCRAV
jgi:hypothetical protein